MGQRLIITEEEKNHILGLHKSKIFESGPEGQNPSQQQSGDTNFTIASVLGNKELPGFEKEINSKTGGNPNDNVFFWGFDEKTNKYSNIINFDRDTHTSGSGNLEHTEDFILIGITSDKNNPALGKSLYDSLSSLNVDRGDLASTYAWDGDTGYISIKPDKNQLLNAFDIIQNKLKTLGVGVTPINSSSKNTKVATLQTKMNEKFKSGLKPDSRWGPKTATAVLNALKSLPTQEPTPQEVPTPQEEPIQKLPILPANAETLKRNTQAPLAGAK